MTLRLKMKGNMEQIQEMLQDSNEIQGRVDKERIKEESLVNQWEDLQLELQETKYRIQELVALHNDRMDDLEQKKQNMYEYLTEERDLYVQKREKDSEFLHFQKKHLKKLEKAFEQKQNSLEKVAKQRSNANKKVGVSMLSLKNKQALLEEMLNEGKVCPKKKSQKVVGNLMRILSQAEINQRFNSKYGK